MTKRRFYKLLTALLIAVLSWYLNQQQWPSTVLGTVSPGYYRVVDFADGDTISVDMDGHTERIRMIGVDTPETHDPRKVVQCFGQAASDYTKQLIGNQPVRLVSDNLSTNRDRYDRLLRYVYLPDDRLVQAEIIKNGYGFAYVSFPFSKSDEFKQFETEARQNSRGLWGSCNPAVNEYGGYTSNSAN
jgi:micrococcal nuclease